MPGVLTRGGVLQMLKIRDQTNYGTRTGQTVGEALPVRGGSPTQESGADTRRSAAGGIA
jgi:hypothetical protein